MTANRITYITAIIALIFFYIYCDSYMPLVILLIVVILPVFAFISGLIAARKTEVGVTSVMKSVLRGEDMKFGISLKNTSIIPISIVKVVLTYTTSVDELPIKRKIYTALSYKEYKTVYIAVSSPHCTVVECNIKKVRCSDALGLFSFKPKVNKEKETVVVMPNIINNALNISSQEKYVMDSDKFSETQKGDDSSQVFEVREYVPGDDVRRIHWGLSSKQDNLIVKEYSKPIADEAIILIESGLISDNKKKSADRTDRVLASFLTLADRIMKEEQSIEVRWYSEKIVNMFSYKITSQWEIYSVIKQFLYDELSHSMNISLRKENSYGVSLESSEIYYIYDSTYSGIEDISKENYIFIDIGQVDTFVK